MRPQSRVEGDVRRPRLHNLHVLPQKRRDVRILPCVGVAAVELIILSAPESLHVEVLHVDVVLLISLCASQLTTSHR